jgi:dCMP deaminase
VPQEKSKFVPWKRLGWDEFFMRIAITATGRVSCNFHRIASVYVDEEHKIISIGYNGPSAGDYDGNVYGCAKVHGDPVTHEIRRCRGVHSEINGIINAFDTRRLKGATLYITQFPCYDCMKVLNNVGIKKVIYLHDYLRVKDGSDGTDRHAEPEAEELAHRRGIILEQFIFPEGAEFNFEDEKERVDKVNNVKTETKEIKKEVAPKTHQKKLIEEDHGEKRF